MQNKKIVVSSNASAPTVSNIIPFSCTKMAESCNACLLEKNPDSQVSFANFVWVDGKASMVMNHFSAQAAHDVVPQFLKATALLYAQIPAPVNDGND